MAGHLWGGGGGGGGVMDSNWSVTDIVPEVGPDIQRRAFIPAVLTYEMGIVDTAVVVLLKTEVFLYA